MTRASLTRREAGHQRKGTRIRPIETTRIESHRRRELPIPHGSIRFIREIRVLQFLGQLSGVSCSARLYGKSDEIR